MYSLFEGDFNTKLQIAAASLQTIRGGCISDASMYQVLNKS